MGARRGLNETDAWAPANCCQGGEAVDRARGVRRHASVELVRPQPEQLDLAALVARCRSEPRRARVNRLPYLAQFAGATSRSPAAEAPPAERRAPQASARPTAGTRASDAPGPRSPPRTRARARSSHRACRAPGTAGTAARARASSARSRPRPRSAAAAGARSRRALARAPPPARPAARRPAPPRAPAGRAARRAPARAPTSTSAAEPADGDALVVLRRPTRSPARPSRPANSVGRQARARRPRRRAGSARRTPACRPGTSDGTGPVAGPATTSRSPRQTMSTQPSGKIDAAAGDARPHARHVRGEIRRRSDLTVHPAIVAAGSGNMVAARCCARPTRPPP